METNFQSVYKTLCDEEQAFLERRNSIKHEAIAYCQQIISDFKLTPSDFTWATKGKKGTVTRTRTVAVKYRTPTGIEWSGQGVMKRAFREYLEANGLTEADKEMFRVDNPLAPGVPVKPFAQLGDIPSEDKLEGDEEESKAQNHGAKTKK